jgi:hypothetical protein
VCVGFSLASLTYGRRAERAGDARECTRISARLRLGQQPSSRFVGHVVAEKLCEPRTEDRSFRARGESIRRQRRIESGSRERRTSRLDVDLGEQNALVIDNRADRFRNVEGARLIAARRFDVAECNGL